MTFCHSATLISRICHDTAVGPRARINGNEGVGNPRTVGGLRRLPLIGIQAVRGWVTWNFAAYNLILPGGIGAWWNQSPT